MTMTKAKMTTKRRLAAIVATGGLAAGSATALAATQTATQTATRTGNTTVTLAPASASAAAATPEPGAAPPPAGGGAGPSGLTVTGVSGHTITARDGRGRTIVVRVSATTTYSEAGARVALSAVATGEHIAVQAVGAKAGATMTARSVTIMLPQVMGQVTAIGRGSITVRGITGATVTVKTTAATRYVRASGTSVAATALKKGVAIMAEGTLSRDGKTLTARRITIGRPSGGPSGPGGTGGPAGPGGPPPSGTPAPSARNV